MVRWYKKAAELGHVRSQYRLGVAYRKGQGVKQDYILSTSWFKKAAEKGNKKTFHALGYAYRKGLGVSHDDMVATRWYRLAASHGTGVKQDHGRAIY